MDIILAESAGFCFGVRRAVSMAEKAAEERGECVTLGPIIHNEDVIERLRSLGVGCVDSVDDVKPGQTVIIRSHGISEDELRQLRERTDNIIDATCPDVSKIHKTVKQESDDGRTVIIIGQREHPEVSAICGWCDSALIAESPEELRRLIIEHPQLREIPVSVVSQTTNKREIYELCIKILKKECTNLKIFDTICFATSKRQSEAEELSHKCDAMIVIGGKHSANSRQLADICRERCGNVLFIENENELDTGLLSDAETVGITAGASTPAWIIKEVNQKMSDEMMVKNENAETESFEEMLERSIKTLYTGEKVVGTIAAITPTEVSVDLGTKQSGYIPLSELTDDPSAKPEDIVKVGDEIETFVIRVNDVEGTVMLSKKRVDSAKAWNEIDKIREEKETVEGIVTEENRGGVVVSVKGLRVFVPASQTGLPRDAAMTELLKKPVKLRITEVNQSRRRVVGSIRAVAFEERKARAEKVWEEIAENKEYTGVVKSLTSYGAFVDIGGVDGMVHVSELSWNRIRQPADMLSVGDSIDVFVISFDKEKKKISLGYKGKGENPWITFTNIYKVGDIANVKIVKLMPFGAFAEIIPGIDGLIHISQIADRRIGKPDEVLTEGESVDVKIIDINNEKQKVSLSIRALIAPSAEPEAVEAEESAEDAVDAVVEDAEETAAETAEAVEAVQEAAAEAVEEVAETAEEAVSETVEAVEEEAADAVDAASDAPEAAVEAVEETTEEAEKE
ncbi:MAG: bifunctional 4-hydroxy-3-methylbut-2-enyl diphosphate reductase/30S ribosomal protein S1 [Oscillospiraceae bacterium]|nr:bifunctional 4-hydroxy-3-methylbut-2-enyl diphosphate reductase/30S ribosomal protein S1 [Oscillospiraceae bacterium]